MREKAHIYLTLQKITHTINFSGNIRHPHPVSRSPAPTVGAAAAGAQYLRVRSDVASSVHATNSRERRPYC